MPFIRLDPASGGTSSVTLGGLGDIAPVATATQSGTATTAAAANHVHTLHPDVAGSGVLLQAGVVSANYGGAGDITAVNTATATGTTTTLARANHQHALAGGIVAPSNMAASAYGADITAVNTATATGAASTFARSDHQHNVAPGIVSSGLLIAGGVISANYGPLGAISYVSTVTQSGTSTTLARADHQHALHPNIAGSGLNLLAGTLVAATPASTTDEIAAVGTITLTGTTTTFARANHSHALNPSVAGDGVTLPDGKLRATSPASTTAEIAAIGTATLTGTTTTYARANHSHALNPSVVGNDLTLSAGVINVSPRVPALGANPVTIGTTTNTGTATTYAPANHSHVVDPAVAGSGLISTSGLLNAANLTNSNAATSFLYTLTSTNTMTATAAVGQQRFDTNSLTQNLFTAAQVWVPMTPVAAVVAQTMSSTQTAFINGKPTSGPAVTLLTNTQVIVDLCVYVSCSASQNIPYVGFAVSGATTVAASQNFAATYQSEAAGAVGTMLFRGLVTGLTPGLNTFTMQYSCVGGGTNTWTNRNIFVTALP